MTENRKPVRPIRILVVDDSKIKRRSIHQAISSHFDSSDFQIDEAIAINPAKEKLKEVAYDLLILDIQLPQRHDSKPLVDGGIRLWRSVCRGPQYRRPLYVIALTAYDDSFQASESVLRGQDWSVVHYEENSSSWIAQIVEKLEHIHAIRFQRSQLKFRSDVVIMTALHRPELEAVLKLPFGFKNPVLIVTEPSSTKAAMKMTENHFLFLLLLPNKWECLRRRVWQ